MRPQCSRIHTPVPYVRQPPSSRFEAQEVLRHVIPELNMLPPVESEPALLERMFDWIGILRDVTEDVL